MTLNAQKSNVEEEAEQMAERGWTKTETGTPVGFVSSTPSPPAPKDLCY
jgi:hypothetical protein